MDNTEMIVADLIRDEITHHGIVGMKWGVRRYQNKDGSLTAAGKKRVAQKKDSKTPSKQKIFEKFKSKTPEKAKPKTPTKPKSLKDMTDEELTKKIRRLQLEKQYNDLQPQKVSKGKEIANKFLDQAVVPATINMGKQFLEKQLKSALGLDEKDDNGLDAMKKQLDELRTTNQLYGQKKIYEKNKAEMEAERKAKVDSEKAAKDAKKDAKQAAKDAKKEAKQAEKEAKEKAEKEAKKAEKESKEEAPEVIVEPVSKSSNRNDDYRNAKDADYEVVYEYDYKDSSGSSSGTTALTTVGRQYVSNNTPLLTSGINDSGTKALTVSGARYLTEYLY